MANKLCIVVCENLKREAAAVIKSGGFEDIKVDAFPADCGHPKMGLEALDAVIHAYANDYKRIYLLGENCTKGIKGVPKKADCGKLCKIEQCFYLLLNRNIIDNYLKQGAYLLTPGWLEHWREYVDKWGFDRQTAKDFFQEFATCLILLDTGVGDKNADNLYEFADFAGLPCEVVPVGLDFFRTFLTKIVLKWRLQEESKEASTALTNANRRLADYAVISELIGTLGEIRTEDKVIESIFELFTMLCAPAGLNYLPFIGNKPGNIQSQPASYAVSEPVKRRLAHFHQDYAWTDSGNGFRLRFSHRDETVGILEINGLTFPEHKEHYLNLAFTVRTVCGLAIANARAYQKIQQALDALERSNRDLEQFAYVASHDLQEPLFKIQAFGDLLKSGYSQALDERGQDFLERMHNSAGRMRTLINDLLGFSRLTTQARPFVAVNLSKIANEVLSDLQARIERMGGRVELLDLPTIEADPMLMHQLLQNLISNAIKFSRPEKAPVVTVHGRLHGDVCQIIVKDNGIGFDEKYIDRIFAIFQRLHGRHEYEGTGVGLAVCRKIVERHGGSITAQSSPGQGAKFIISLPVKQPQEGDLQ